MEITPLRVLICVIAFIVLILVALILADQGCSAPLSSVVLGSAVVGAGLALRAGKTHDNDVYRVGGGKQSIILKTDMADPIAIAVADAATTALATKYGLVGSVSEDNYAAYIADIVSQLTDSNIQKSIGRPIHKYTFKGAIPKFGKSNVSDKTTRYNQNAVMNTGIFRTLACYYVCKQLVGSMVSSPATTTRYSRDCYGKLYDLALNAYCIDPYTITPTVLCMCDAVRELQFTSSVKSLKVPEGLNDLVYVNAPRNIHARRIRPSNSTLRKETYYNTLRNVYDTWHTEMLSDFTALNKSITLKPIPGGWGKTTAKKAIKITNYEVAKRAIGASPHCSNLWREEGYALVIETTWQKAVPDAIDHDLLYNALTRLVGLTTFPRVQAAIAAARDNMIRLPPLVNTIRLKYNWIFGFGDNESKSIGRYGYEFLIACIKIIMAATNFLTKYEPKRHKLVGHVDQCDRMVEAAWDLISSDIHFYNALDPKVTPRLKKDKDWEDLKTPIVDIGSIMPPLVCISDINEFAAALGSFQTEVNTVHTATASSTTAPTLYKKDVDFLNDIPQLPPAAEINIVSIPFNAFLLQVNQLRGACVVVTNNDTSGIFKNAPVNIRNEADKLLKACIALHAIYRRPPTLSNAQGSCAEITNIKDAVAELQKATTAGGSRLEVFDLVPGSTAFANLETHIIALDPVRLLPGSVQGVRGNVPNMPWQTKIDKFVNPDYYSEKHITGLSAPLVSFANAVFGVNGIGETITKLFRRNRFDVNVTKNSIENILHNATVIVETCHTFGRLPDGYSQTVIDQAEQLFLQELQAIETIIIDKPNACLMEVDGADQVAPFNTSAGVARAALDLIPKLVMGQGPQIKQTPIEAPTMLNDEQKLINYAVPPVAAYSLIQTAEAVPVGSHTDFVIEAGTREMLERMKFPGGGRQLYGLVVDKPGDMVALYKAIAINVGLSPPPDIKSKFADRTRGASGWLYEIVRTADSDIHALRLRTYIKSSDYAVST